MLVVYDQDRALKAQTVFSNLLKNCSTQHTLCVVSNNQGMCIGDINGSNIAAEFSGWDEGLSQYNLEQFDAIVFANDTFCTRRTFNKCDIDKFTKSIIKACRTQSNFIIGEVSWSINYSRLLKGRKFLLRWIRTSIFAMPPATYTAIRGVGINPCALSHLIKIDSNSRLLFEKSIRPLMRERIQNWLFPKDASIGWYKSNIVSIESLQLKAKCILQELDLAIRCEVSGSTLIPLNNINFLKLLIFTLLYRFQRFFPD